MATTLNETFTIPPSPEADGTARFDPGEQVDFRASHLDKIAQYRAEALGAAAHRQDVRSPKFSDYDYSRTEGSDVVRTLGLEAVSAPISEAAPGQREETPTEIIQYVALASAHLLRNRTAELDIPRQYREAT